MGAFLLEYVCKNVSINKSIGIKDRKAVKNMIKLSKIKFLGRKKMYKLNTDKVIEKINETWLNKNCPCCGQNHWAIGDQITTLVSIDENKTIRLTGSFQPLVSVTCNNCGYVRFINCLVADAIEKTEEE